MISSSFFPLNGFKNSIWILGIPSCLFGAIDRIVATFADGYVSFVELSHFLVIACLLASWISLKPELIEELNTSATNISEKFARAFEPGKFDVPPHQDTVHFPVLQSRILDIEKHHVISQTHVLPFPYLSQIYHLLNLKHLETVHSLSLGGLKVLNVHGFNPTSTGGSVKFKTTLSSPINILKIWRQPVAEVELFLHTPYTVELNIPVYGEKKMIVMFNAFPLSSDSHEFLIDIYTNLRWPKSVLSILLHLASLITIYEDLPYLRRLSQRNLWGLLSSGKTASHETMWLFQRFVDLYAVTPHQSQDAAVSKKLISA